MSQRILLQDKAPGDVSVDRHKIGISYSGGGPLVLIELGIARAFVQMGIIPHVITGVSAGGLAGTAHALDPHCGKGIDMAQRLLCQISSRTLGLDVNTLVGRLQLGARLLAQRTHMASLGDNAPIKPHVTRGLASNFDLHDVTIGLFAQSGRPKLLIGATNRLNGTAEWFPDDTPIEDALIASSAIPGIFPWRNMTVGQRPIIVVDGGVVTNQPLSNLALEEHCGTIIACAVGYAGGAVAAPTNALDNAFGSISLLAHQCEKLEEAYVRAKLGGQGVIHHIHPEVSFPVQSYDFTPPLVEQVIRESCEKTTDWLQSNKKIMEECRRRDRDKDTDTDGLWWLRHAWPDED